MKIVAIGDVHGRSNWASIVSKEELSTDLFVFIGDYFDSWDEKPSTIMENFEMILAYKKQFPDKVVLLLGNHELHYIQPGERYSGYNEKNALNYYRLIQPALEAGLIKVAHRWDNYVFTHAGITEEWCKMLGLPFADHFSIDDLINDINGLGLTFLGFYGGDISGSGEHPKQGPLWVRPDTLKDHSIGFYKQVVGHTQQEHIDLTAPHLFIDTIEAGEYLIITDGVPSVGKI